ncbi:uncharacterized protein LOC143257711 [Tachypleus tridentatus]|uniref:uncharacterized protein LOC143257711 n=1 Tax=Tachypleus tridentatus TaxID=6853 RepID=UPI003FCF5616
MSEDYTITEVRKTKKTKKKKISYEVDTGQRTTDGPQFQDESRNELVYTDEFSKTTPKDIFTGHFCCWQCDDSLTGQRYVLREMTIPTVFAATNKFFITLEDCNKIIGIDSVCGKQLNVIGYESPIAFTTKQFNVMELRVLRLSLQIS